MSKTVHNTKTESRKSQLQRLNEMRGFRKIDHRTREQMRERAFNAVYGGAR